MDEHIKAIVSKASGTDFLSSIGGRLFLDKAPQGTEFPYVVFFIVYGGPDEAFGRKGRNILVQFSIFSASPGGAEIAGIYNALRKVYDDCTLTITGHGCIWMHEMNFTTAMDDADTVGATTAVRHWISEYEIITQENGS